MMKIVKKKNYLFLESLLVISLVVFLIYLIVDLGLFSLIVESDKSKISIIILGLYLISCIHWFFVALNLDKEIKSIENPDKTTLIGSFVADITSIGQTSVDKKITLLQDELSNKFSFGYLVVDVLLKLGLTGTVIGFILMLLPIGEIQDFDPKILQKLLSTMSGGMAVALYTTLTGLISSMLLKFQYFLLDMRLSDNINYLSAKFSNEA
tara:strand:- start:566 stop:1192 length:627 start_codon:yes stop_codon:yes gene_type:complete